MANLLDIFTKKTKGNMLAISDTNPVKYGNLIARLNPGGNASSAMNNVSTGANRDVNSSSAAYASINTKGSILPKVL